MCIAYSLHQNQTTYIIHTNTSFMFIPWYKKWIKSGLSPSTIPVSFSTSSEGNSPLLRRIRCRPSTPIAWLLCVPCSTLATTKTTLRTEKSVELYYIYRIKIYHDVHIKGQQKLIHCAIPFIYTKAYQTTLSTGLRHGAASWCSSFDSVFASSLTVPIDIPHHPKSSFEPNQPHSNTRLSNLQYSCLLHVLSHMCSQQEWWSLYNAVYKYTSQTKPCTTAHLKNSSSLHMYQCSQFEVPIWLLHSTGALGVVPVSMPIPSLCWGMLEASINIARCKSISPDTVRVNENILVSNLRTGATVSDSPAQNVICLYESPHL